MPQDKRIQVTGDDGLIGYVTSRPGPDGSVLVHLSDGRDMTVPASELREQSDGTYYLPLGKSSIPAPGGNGGSPANPVVVPVIEEHLVADKRPVVKGRVRVRKKTEERHETVDMLLKREHVEIRRVSIDRDIDDFVPVRHEGDTTIIPVFEEVLVVEKRLRLKEEIHIIHRRETERHVEEVTLKSERAEIERVDEAGNSKPVVPQKDILPEEPRRRSNFIRDPKIIPD
jgi:uncharacterized protein (TIGR02271 family)